MGEKERLDAITGTIISAAIEVHRALGPGLLESAYEACLTFELGEKGLEVERQKPLPVFTSLNFCPISNSLDARWAFC